MPDPRIEEIFQAVVGLPPERRRAEVVRLCGGDAALEARCLRLLEAADEASRVGALEGGAAAMFDTPSLVAAAGLRQTAAGADHPLSIGPYRILGVLGEGGFGVVYAAERREPIRQRVALKVIKPGMDSRAVLARFEQERQALAVMSHPNIAQVFDAGVTEEALGSRPYFVMEHVAGEPITAYCDRHNLTLRQRLELFIPVCEAVQHAHHKGIIHRDIKPSNILVAVHDGKPVPKVIDFGIAKATAKALTDATIFTEAGQLIGTPEYMSPEQTGMGAADVDTRTDVYSLGAVLYELLTGAVPFDSKSLRAAALLEIQRIICEVDPPKPSTRLTSLGGDEAATIARCRQMGRDALAAELRRELDWIPLKALRKDRAERYATPKDLADDIRNYLEGRPLEAGPESMAYRLRKFVRRHRGPVAAGSIVAAALILGIVGLGLGLRRASIAEAEQRRLAEHNAELAESEAAQRSRADERAEAAEQAEAAAIAARDAERERAEELTQVSEFQSQMLGRIDTTQAGIDLMADIRERFVTALEAVGIPEEERTARLDALRRELVRVNATDAAAAMIDRTILRPAIATIDERFQGQPAVDAQLRQALADIYRTIGLYDAAFPLQESALATRRRVLGEEHTHTLMSIGDMGGLLRLQGRLDEAELYLHEALEKSRRVLGQEHPDTLMTINSMGALLRLQGRLDEAEPYLREALESRRRVLGEEHPNTLNSINSMGVLLRFQGRLAEAEPYTREALESRRRVLGEEHPDTLMSIGNMGSLLWSQGRLAEAEPYFREALEKHRRVRGEEHPSTLISIHDMGNLLRSQGRPSEAEQHFREALEKQRRVLGEEHLHTLISIHNMGALLRSQGRLAEAEPYLREALEARRRVLGEEHPHTLMSIGSMGVLLSSQGRLAEAEPYYREALEKSRRVLGEEHPGTLASIGNMGILLGSQGRLDEAEPYFREAMEADRRVLGEEHPDTLRSISNMGNLLRDQGRLAEAEPYLREALEARRRVLGEDHPDTLDSIGYMGTLLRLQGRLTEAEPYAREALEKFRHLLGEGHPNTLISIGDMGTLLRDQGRFAEAIDLLAPAEPAARAAFTGGNVPRLASFLITLARARVSLGHDAGGFPLAEAGLLEAHPILLEARGETHADTLGCVQSLVDLYTAWDEAEPGKGYAEAAETWRSRLPE